MFICVSNGAKNRSAENYDKLIDLTKEEGVINDWLISKKGIVIGEKGAKTKDALQQFYKFGFNQIVSNDSKTNFTWVTPTGEIIEFVGIGNHLEKEI